MRKRSHASLKGLSAAYLANELNMTPHSLYERQRARFAADENAAARLLAVGESMRGRRDDPVRTAALTTRFTSGSEP